MATTQKQHTELNAMQVSLLRLFNRPMSEEQTLILKDLLVDHYSRLLDDELDKVVAERGYTQKDFNDMLNGDD
ncbi:hypothetical protein [Mucilaginibacter psychrotolerans]|nr:hypothetical protein [Mucilaginibacter psychrotolerans]